MRPQLLISLLLCCLASTAGAQSTNVSKRLITLKECVNLALDHNLDLQIRRLSTEIAGYRTAAYGAYDPLLTLQAGRTYVDQPSRIDPKDSLPDNPYKLSVNSFGPSLSGVLPWGLTYNAFTLAENLDLDSSILPNVLSPFPQVRHRPTNYYTANVGMILRQPLLKNFWIDAQRRDLQLAKADLKISETALRASLMTNITHVQQAYYDLILDRELLGVQRKALELARQLFDETRKKVQAGADAPLSEKQAEAHVENVQTDMFAAEQDYAAQQNALKLKLTDDFRAWIDVELEPTETLLAIEQSVDRQESWLRAMRNRPDLVEKRLELEKEKIIVRYDQNQLLPSLDAFGGFGWKSVEDGLSSAYSDVARGEHNYYSVGAVLSIPLGNVAARNNLKASKANRQQAVLRLKRQEDSVLADVDTALKDMTSLYKRITSTRNSRVYSELALDAEMKKLANGVATSFVVLRYQRDLASAASAELKAIAAYNKAIATLAQQEGTTLEKHQIELRVR